MKTGAHPLGEQEEGKSRTDLSLPLTRHMPKSVTTRAPRPLPQISPARERKDSPAPKTEPGKSHAYHTPPHPGTCAAQTRNLEPGLAERGRGN